MIIYNPTNGTPIDNISNQPKHSFLMTRLGNPIPPPVQKMRNAIEKCCQQRGYSLIDAETQVTGRNVLLKIWKLIASTPLSIGVMHKNIPASTQANIYYEIGVAQALGKETVFVKSPGFNLPSDFSGTEYIEFDNKFNTKFNRYFDSIIKQAGYYELLAEQLEKDPVLALDYLKRAYLITGKTSLKKKAQNIVKAAGLEKRARNSVEMQLSAF